MDVFLQTRFRNDEDERAWTSFLNKERRATMMPHEMSGERIGQRVAHKIESYATTAGEKIDEAIDFAGSKSQAMKTSINDFGSGLKRKVEGLSRDFPYRSLLIGFGTGFCCGRLLRRRTR
jgi:hypothetical protein